MSELSCCFDGIVPAADRSAAYPRSDSGGTRDAARVRLVRRRRAVPAQEEGDLVEGGLADLGAGELAVEERRVVLQPLEQRQAAIDAKVVPAEVQVRQGRVL